MTPTTHPSLRERQQLATRREIVTAALDLFEEQGFRATTIDEIAQDVGVSARTVFRHFDTKIDLVLGWLPDVEALIEEVPLTQRHPSSALAQIENSIEDMLAQYTSAETSEGAESFARFRRLVGTDPDLQSALSAWESRLSKLAHRRLHDLLGEDTDELGIRLIIQLATAPISAAVEGWTHSLDSDLLALYREARVRRGLLLFPTDEPALSPDLHTEKG